MTKQEQLEILQNYMNKIGKPNGVWLGHLGINYKPAEYLEYLKQYKTPEQIDKLIISIKEATMLEQ